MLTKNRVFAFRISDKNYETIKNKAIKGKMTMTDYITSVALGREIIVVEELKPVISELKGIGRNLNQLTTLANMNRIKYADLSETKTKLNEIFEIISNINEVKKLSRR